MGKDRRCSNKNLRNIRWYLRGRNQVPQQPELMVHGLLNLFHGHAESTPPFHFNITPHQEMGKSRVWLGSLSCMIWVSLQAIIRWFWTSGAADSKQKHDRSSYEIPKLTIICKIRYIPLFTFVFIMYRMKSWRGQRTGYINCVYEYLCIGIYIAN